MTAIFNFDASILLWIQEHLRNAVTTPIVTVITHLGDHGAFGILLALALLCFRKTRKIGVACAIAVALGGIVTNLILKNWVARIRPYELIQGMECIVARETDFSFPSGHTTNCLAAGWVLFRMTPKKYGVPALTLAVLVALSRLYVGVHYPTDVLAGFVIGIACAVAAIHITNALYSAVKARRKEVGNQGTGNRE